jgi:hypothetical protein
MRSGIEDPLAGDRAARVWRSITMAIYYCGTNFGKLQTDTVLLQRFNPPAVH